MIIHNVHVFTHARKIGNASYWISRNVTIAIISLYIASANSIRSHSMRRIVHRLAVFEVQAWHSDVRRHL